MTWTDRFTWPLQALSDMQRDVMAMRMTLLQIPARITRMETLLMTAADNLAARLDAATNELAADLTSVRDALAAAVAGQDQAVQDAVSAELAKLDAPIARLEALGADEADPVPAPEEPTLADPETPPADEPTPPAA